MSLVNQVTTRLHPGPIPLLVVDIEWDHAMPKQVIAAAARRAVNSLVDSAIEAVMRKGLTRDEAAKYLRDAGLERQQPHLGDLVQEVRS
jgi:hypothetical protein